MKSDDTAIVLQPTAGVSALHLRERLLDGLGRASALNLRVERGADGTEAIHVREALVRDIDGGVDRWWQEGRQRAVGCSATRNESVACGKRTGAPSNRRTKNLELIVVLGLEARDEQQLATPVRQKLVRSAARIVSERECL